MSLQSLLLTLTALQLAQTPSQSRNTPDAGGIEVVLKVAGEGLVSRDIEAGGIVYFWLGIRNATSSGVILSEVTSVGVALRNDKGPLASVLTTGISHCMRGTGNHLILPGETFFSLVRLKVKKKDLSATAVEAHVSFLEAANPRECGTISRYGKGRFAMKFSGAEVVLSPESGR